jgi:hypothetical protein
MIKRPTVMVLGAGASVPFKFPTGLELSNQMVISLQLGNSSSNALNRDIGFGIEEINEFRDAFFMSGKNSIDSFLEHRPEFLRIGKAAISATLIPYERSDRVFSYESDNWLRYTFNQMSARFEDFAENRLSIVTFNYDRVVEHFFFTSLKNSYGKHENECVEMLKHIPIIHLHGRLGFLPWQKPNNRPFEPNVNKLAMLESMENLKIIHEDIKDGRDAEFIKAKQLLSEAEQIYFMGFGFNRTNVDRLDIVNLAHGKSHATAVGLTSRELGAISKITDNKISFHSVDCIGMCRERINWS